MRVSLIAPAPPPPQEIQLTVTKEEFYTLFAVLKIAILTTREKSSVPTEYFSLWEAFSGFARALECQSGIELS